MSFLLYGQFYIRISLIAISDKNKYHAFMKILFNLSAQLRYWDVILITIGISGLALILALISGCMFGSRKVRFDI